MGGGARARCACAQLRGARLAAGLAGKALCSLGQSETRQGASPLKARPAPRPGPRGPRDLPPRLPGTAPPAPTHPVARGLASRALLKVPTCTCLTSLKSNLNFPVARSTRLSPRPFKLSEASHKTGGPVAGQRAAVVLPRSLAGPRRGPPQVMLWLA